MDDLEFETELTFRHVSEIRSQPNIFLGWLYHISQKGSSDNIRRKQLEAVHWNWREADRRALERWLSV